MVNPQPALVLICGLPGAGKTTLAKRLEAERGGVRLCPDEWIQQILAEPLDLQERDRLRDPVENLQWDLAQRLLGTGITVILENGFWAEEERTLYAIGALDLGASIELYYLEVSHDELWRRIVERNKTERVFAMTREEVEEAWRMFQPPAPEELGFYDVSEVLN